LERFYDSNEPENYATEPDDKMEQGEKRNEYYAKARDTGENAPEDAHGQGQNKPESAKENRLNRPVPNELVFLLNQVENQTPDQGKNRAQTGGNIGRKSCVA
jgi:hypothetical protein